MNIKSKIRKVTYSSALLLMSTLSFGCGSASNDQGVSFTLLSYMALEEGNVCSLDTAASVYTSSLGLDEDSGGAATFGCVTVQNNLTGEFIRTERIDLSYFIPGATEQPPSTSSPLAFVLGPLGSDEDSATTGGGSSLSPGFTSLGSRASLGFLLVSDETHRWLSLNRDKLPEPPFTMHVTSSIVGVTSAGDVLQSNSAGVPVTMRADIIINGDEGSSGDEAIEDIIDDGSGTDESTDGIIE